MKTRILIIAITLLIGLFSACTDKKKTDDKPKIEVKSAEDPGSIEDNVDEDEKRRIDSIRQVKEHGHAH